MSKHKRYKKAKRDLEKWIHKVGRALIKAQKYSIMCDRKMKEYELALEEMNNNG